MRTRLIRLVSPAVQENITSFTNRFEEDMEVNPNAEIALLNATIPLDDNLLIVSTINDTIQVSYNGGTSYVNATIADGTYTKHTLANAIQQALQETTPINGGAGVQYILQSTADGKLEINFWQTRTFKDDDGNYVDTLNLLYDDITDKWSADLDPDFGAGQYYLVSTIPLSLGSGFAQVDVLGTPSAGGGVNLGLGPISTLEQAYAGDNAIDIADVAQIAYGMRLEGANLYYYHEGAARVLLSSSVIDGDSMQIRFDNLTGGVRYSLERGGATVISATVPFSNALRYLESADQLCPYVGLDPDGVSFCSDVRFTPDVDDNVEYLDKTLVLQFPNSYAESFYGFRAADVRVTANGKEGGSFQGSQPPKNNTFVPAIAVELSNLTLETYDGKDQNNGQFGRRKSIVAVIPGIEPQNRSITYEPNDPTYISINNRDAINLREFQVRLLKEDDTYLEFLPRACLTLAIRD